MRGAEGEAEERIEFAPRGFFEIGRRNIGRKESIGESSTRESASDRRTARRPRTGVATNSATIRVVGTYREPRAFGVNADFTLLVRAEQGVRSSFSFTRQGVTAESLERLTPAVRAQRSILVGNDGKLRRAAGPGRSGDDRSIVSAGAVVGSRAPSPATPATTRRTRARDVPERRGHPGRPRDRRPGGIRQGLLSGRLVHRLPRAERRRVRDPCGRRAG